MKNIFTHRIPSYHNSHKQLSLLACLFLFLLSFTECIANESHVFLICGASSEITSVPKHDLRRVFLGGSAINSPLIENPVINKSNSTTYKLFLKNIMHMTENGYKRKIIKRLFRQGSDKIKIIDDLRTLDQHFKDHPNDISFISEEQMKHMINIRIVQKLW